MVFTKLIVGVAEILVRKDLVGFTDSLKFLVRRWIVGVFV